MKGNVRHYINLSLMQLPTKCVKMYLSCGVNCKPDTRLILIFITLEVMKPSLEYRLVLLFVKLYKNNRDMLWLYIDVCLPCHAIKCFTWPRRQTVLTMFQLMLNLHALNMLTLCTTLKIQQLLASCFTFLPQI